MMAIKKFLKNVVIILTLIFCLAVIFILSLFQSVASKPFSIERAFSSENIKEVLIVVALSIICWVPLKFLWNKLTKKKFN